MFRNVGIQNSDVGELPRRKHIQHTEHCESLKSRIHCICFLLGNSPASEFCMLMFQNTLSHLRRHLRAYENGTECSETLAYKIQTSGNYPEENIYNILNTVKVYTHCYGLFFITFFEFLDY